MSRQYGVNRRGFSLVELLVVIGILGVLATLILSGNMLAREAARDAERIETVNELALLFELYKIENGRYPDCPNSIIIEKVEGVPADFQNADGTPDCPDIDQINAFFDKQAPGRLVDPLGSGIFEHVYVYDGVHNCAGESAALVFSKMEVQENANAAKVCPQGSNNDGGYETSGGEPTYPYAVRLE